MIEKNHLRIISELPSSTVKLITATQIATSVCNVVKELVENALDAGSTVVRVKLENSGLSKIEVIDNGSGVSKENVLKMALPHYTSKINQHQDLEDLSTYGFRGEALAAICAVAKLSVTTKTAEDPVASTYTMDSNGDVVDVKPSHLSHGTLVVMTSLFWNIPVRKQYYQTPKRKKEELIKVEELLLNYGLIHPELHLSLHHDHSLVWQKNRATDFKTNILQTLGHEICSHMEFIIEDDVIQMALMVPKRTAPFEICYRNRPDHCFTFINQRPVISKDIEKLMKDLYGFIRDGNQKSTAAYPIFIVSLNLPGDEVDVNVEPNKTKVLMKRQGDVLELIKKRVGDILGPNLAEEKPAEINFQTCENSAINLDMTEVRIVEETIIEDQHKRPTAAPLCTQFETTLESQVGFRQLESTRIDGVDGFPEDDCLFQGFTEPFQMPVEKEILKTNESAFNQPELIAIGSDQWSRGLATNSDGQIVHAIQVLRGQPHLVKRLSDPPVLGNLAKKPKLIETMEASRIIGSSPSLLETVNGKVRKIPVDPFGEYCKDVRNEILSQDPTMSFTELSQNLSNGWKNLDKNSREKYEERAETHKQRYNANKLRTPKTSMSNTSLDRYLHGSETPVIRTERTPKRSVITSAPPPKRTLSSVDFSMEILNQSLESSQSKTTNQWFCLKKIESDSYLCSNGHDVMAVNFIRLYEMILYSRLASEHIIPSRTISNPILIDKKYKEKLFGDLQGWRKLLSLPSEWETATTRTISDARIVSNGVGIRLGVDSDDTGIVVYKVPSNVKRFELNDAKKFLRLVTKEDSTVESCRPEQLIMNLKGDAARLAAGRCTEPDTTEVCQLLEQWLSTDPENVCLHGEPVFWSHSLDYQTVDKESEA